MEITRFRRTVSLALALTMSFTIATGVYADDAVAAATTGTTVVAGLETSYKDYYNAFSQTRPVQEAVIAGKDFTSVSDPATMTVADVDGKTQVLNWAAEKGTVTYQVNIPTAGAYNMEMVYYALAGKANDVEFGLAIDGTVPFDAASRLTLSKVWVNDPTDLESDGVSFLKDFKSNDIRPGQIEKPMWQTKDLEDIDGLYSDPLIFNFTAGVHTITLTSDKANLAISQIRFYNEAAPAAYQAPSSSDLAATDGVETIRLEGEQATYKSDRALSPTSDKTTYLTSPSSPTKTLYNTIGAGNWSKATQTVTWSVTVAKAGYYKLGIRARQNVMRGFYSNRRLTIDGTVPNAESEQIKFYYNTEWQVVSPEADGDPMYYYLDAGTHEIALEVVPGEIGELMGQLDEIVLAVNDYYRQIVKITGPTPDKYTDYTIANDIPTIVGDFKTYSAQLKSIKEQIEKLSKSGGTEATTIEKLSMVLDNCVNNEQKIAQMVTQLKDNVTTMSSWMRQYREQPLELDFIELTAPDQDFTSADKSFFQSLKYAILAFIGTFFNDYNQISDVSGTDSLKVWVMLGRDQAQVVKQITESDFNPTSDVKAAISLVQGGVLEATLSGRGPDVVLFLGSDFPIQLAARGLLTDISSYPDFNDVMTRFSKNAGTLYTYNNNVYGLPVSQSFPMLFYRNDILTDLGIDAKTSLQTWDGLDSVMPVLMRNYMEIGLILPVLTSVNGVATVLNTTEAGNTFATLLIQQGLNFFNSDLSKTAFDSQAAVDAFTKWTSYYNDYDFKQTYDAFTRFRTGQMPIVINNYAFYNQLAVAAPEIKGEWGMMQMPGTVQADGTINHSSNSAGSGGFIFKSCEHQEAAWTFLKWFTSTETQVQYANDIESFLGLLGRFETANIEALKSLSWSSDELDLLTAQLTSQVEIPIIPASYAVTTNLMNAFRQVVNHAENPRDTLMWYNKDINSEIERKNDDLKLSQED
ncbi:MAG: extracellular solute-binding protein [Oscillospiraceae bacterium]